MSLFIPHSAFFIHPTSFIFIFSWKPFDSFVVEILMYCKTYIVHYIIFLYEFVSNYLILN